MTRKGFLGTLFGAFFGSPIVAKAVWENTKKEKKTFDKFYDKKNLTFDDLSGFQCSGTYSVTGFYPISSYQVSGVVSVF